MRFCAVHWNCSYLQFDVFFLGVPFLGDLMWNFQSYWNTIIHYLKGWDMSHSVVTLSDHTTKTFQLLFVACWNHSNCWYARFFGAILTLCWPSIKFKYVFLRLFHMSSTTNFDRHWGITTIVCISSLVFHLWLYVTFSGHPPRRGFKKASQILRSEWPALVGA